MVKRDDTMKKWNFCLVGAGSIGRRHLRLLLERDDVKMSVVEPYEKGRERLMEEYPSIPLYYSMDEAMKTEKLDAFIIATPHGLHAEMAIKALNAGINVFCEKPMSDALNECVVMRDAVVKSGKVFSVGFMFRFDPFVLKVKEIIKSGKIGKIVHYYSRFATYNTLLCSVTKHQQDTPYSLLMDCIHDTDLMCFFLEKTPDKVFANAVKAGDMQLSSPQNIIDTVYSFNNKELLASIHYNYVQHPQVHVLEITGDKGYIQGDFMTAEITVGTIDGKVEKLSAKREFDNVYRAEWEGFIQALKGEREIENDAVSAMQSILILQAQKDALTTGKEVDIHQVSKKYGFDF